MKGALVPTARGWLKFFSSPLGPLLDKSSGNLQPRQASGFSLIELLVIAALLLILTSLYWSSTAGTRQKKLQAACQDNLQKLYMAMDIFAKDHEGKFPEQAGARTSEEPLDLLVPRYTADTGVFICPGSKNSALPSGESIRKHRISYAYYMGLREADSGEVLVTDEQVNTQSKTTGQPLFSSTGKSPGANHDKSGGNLLFCDGHVQAAPVNAPVSLVLTQGMVLLNPKR